MDSAATFTQYYQNSPNFTSIEREKNNDLIRTIPKQLIPTKTTNINNILKKDPNFKSFNSEFRFTSPSDIYKSIISETRSSLPFNEVLMNKIDVMYKRVIETNLNAVYKWSPNFFIKTFYTQTFNSNGNKQITINQENFIKYEKYIYLLCLIYYINHNKEKIRGELNKDADAIINWAQIRNNDAIGYILNGPDSTYEIPGDFISHYNLLLSTANAIDDLAVQNQLAKTDSGVSFANVTFEPGCRNNWHIHEAKSGGGQVLICVEGEGWYQEEGKPAQSLKEGDVVVIPANVTTHL